MKSTEKVRSTQCYVGNSRRYFTYDSEPSNFDGLYHVGEGGTWGWHHVKTFKTARGAHNWAVKRNFGKDEYRD